jgi:hypothetical protein
MTRRFLDDLRSDLSNQLTTGNATKATELLPLLIDTIDSTIQDECSIFSTSATNNFDTIEDTWVKLDGVFDEQNGGDGVFLKPDLAESEIVSNTIAGYSYEVNAVVSFEGTQNARFDFIILANDVPMGIIGIETGEGNNDPVTSNPRAFIQSAVSNMSFSVAVRNSSSSNDIDIISATLYVNILPTNNP